MKHLHTSYSIARTSFQKITRVPDSSIAAGRYRELLWGMPRRATERLGRGPRGLGEGGAHFSAECTGGRLSDPPVCRWKDRTPSPLTFLRKRPSPERSSCRRSSAR